ncbi:MAG TPA: hypothetical protein VL400_13150 [Polyangiaceae bacterium]|nr:hypothetical protein [Polyangiaceae bacterium]
MDNHGARRWLLACRLRAATVIDREAERAEETHRGGTVQRADARAGRDTKHVTFSLRGRGV